MGHHENGPIEALDDGGHRESLAASSHPEQDLVLSAGLESGCECLHGLRLIALGNIFRYEIELHGSMALPYTASPSWLPPA